MRIYRFLIFSAVYLSVALIDFSNSYAQALNLQNISVYQEASATTTEKAAAEMFCAEVNKRTGEHLIVVNTWPAKGDVIVLRRASVETKMPFNFFAVYPVPQKPEGYRIFSHNLLNRHVVEVDGFDERGVLFGTGRLLRMIQYKKSGISFSETPSLSSWPEKSIRGHQLGYRNTANSYDGWTKKQFEQYIKDLIVFGTNSIESIPIFDEKSSPHFKVPPREMNSYISSVCDKYSLDYWMWVPAQFDLSDSTKRKNYLATFEKICKESVRVNGVFFPGGDPGDNSPELVMPLLQDVSVVLKRYHPDAKVWLSLQGFTVVQCRYVYRFIRDKMPPWLGGLITGPSSPTAQETRPELPAQYKIRHYPDLTHNVRCEFEIPWWDPAFSLTLGREAVNPRPYHYAAIYRAIQPYIDGFISYSDGIHDDVNKIIWTVLSWNKQSDEREILKEYSNYFFGSDLAETAADGILALEKNWQGPIVSNGGITTTMFAWKQLEKENPRLKNNWRWQMNLLRAYYDAYVRERYVYETKLEQAANEILATAGTIPPNVAINEAKRILSKKPSDPGIKSLRNKITELCDHLYQSIALQTSVEKYKASGRERGAVLDFLDRPLNNRWWLEDEFERIGKLREEEQAKELKAIAAWEDPGAGGYYDEVGNVSKSSHELKGEHWMMDPMLKKNINPGYDFSDQGMSRKRLSWLTSMRWPQSMEYTNIDTAGTYIVRITGLGECLLKVNGKRVAPSVYGKKLGEIKEFPLTKEAVKEGKLILTWDDVNEDNLNWRVQSRVSEVWLIKNN